MCNRIIYDSIKLIQQLKEILKKNFVENVIMYLFMS